MRGGRCINKAVCWFGCSGHTCLYHTPKDTGGSGQSGLNFERRDPPSRREQLGSLAFGVCGEVFLWAGVHGGEGRVTGRKIGFIMHTANVCSSKPEPGPKLENDGAAVMGMM